MRSFASAAGAAACLLALSSGVGAQSSQVRALYEEATARETALRRELDRPSAEGDSAGLLRRLRTLVETFEDMSKLFPASGYSDDALWRGALLSADAFWQFGASEDRNAAIRLLESLASRFPSSSLVKRVPDQLQRLRPPRAARPPGSASAPATTRGPQQPRPAPAQVTTLVAIRREVLPDAIRVTLELEQETPFREERLDGPPRVFIDFQNTRASTALVDARMSFAGDVVRQIRVGRQLNARIRVVMDLDGAARHSVYTLYNPYRVVVEFERAAGRTPAPAGRVADAGASPRLPASAPGASWPAASPPSSGSAPAPAAPSSNAVGGFSLSRQLGLGIARVVVDPGHGGHDPGAKGKGLTEAELVLDVALRLEKLLREHPAVDVVLTRRTNVYIPLEERTAIANREGADLFLSIHANASATAAASGIETYFLNFAPTAEAEAIAARENAGSAKTMRHLPDIVRAIALNNKIDESRDFAASVQRALVERLRKVNRTVKNLGVKQAPFMVLIGATMPSALAEISFVTHRQEASLLVTDDYRQQIAEALAAGIIAYQQSLKKVPAIALQ